MHDIMADLALKVLVLVRQAHGAARLLFPFEMQDLTKEGIKGCDAAHLKSSECLFATSTFAQSAVLELAWTIIFQTWKGSLHMKALIFAVINLILATADTWSAQGADIDVIGSFEVNFSQKMSMLSFVIAVLIWRKPDTVKATEQPKDGKESETIFMDYANEMYYTVSCLLKLLTSFSYMWEPLQAANLSKIEAWSQIQRFHLARLVAVAGTHSTALGIALLFIPSTDYGGLTAYLLLLSTQVFCYVADSTIANRMPVELGYAQLLGGHAFFVTLFCLGIFVLFLSWRKKAYGQPTIVSDKQE